MKYYITYRITHPQYTPTTATGVVEAHTRPEVEACLARGIKKWKTQDYTVEILKIASIEDFQRIRVEGTH